MFDAETSEEMIFPYIKKFVAKCHSLGVFYEHHSCGKVETFVPCMIDARINLWMSRDRNDKLMFVKKYGDRTTIGVETLEPLSC